MRQIVIFLALVALAPGCADGGGNAKKPPAAESGPGDSDSESMNDDDDEVLEAEQSSQSTDPITDPATDPPADPPRDPAPTQPTERKAQCSSTAEGHTSLTKIVYEVSGSNVVVKSIDVDIDNKSNRNENDIDVYVTPPGGKESKVFNSGDILDDGKSTSVPVPTGFKPALNSQLRISTNFDTSFTDPWADCKIDLK